MSETSMRAIVLGAALVAAAAPAARGQGGSTQDRETPPEVLERLERLEAENAEFRQMFYSITDEIERIESSEVFPALPGEGDHGLGRAASKVYSRQGSGISIGGYGEALYTNFTESGGADQFDFQRAVVYIGFKADENWIFNSELEFEHATTDESGSVSVEFAYLDRLITPAVNVRVGLLLIPVGLLTELHEPTAYLPAARPETESRIIPSTWRENGVGVFGEAGPIVYRVYVVTGMDATGFSSKGLRGGRQKGSKALAEDFALVVRADWVDVPGLLAGGSVYYGNSGQDQAGLRDTGTMISEVHADLKWRGLWFRALGAWASVDDVTELNAALGNGATASVGEEMEGHYFEVGYDVLSLLVDQTEQALYPYIRYESIDTQADVPAGFTPDPAFDVEIMTYGLHYQPNSQIVFKLEFAEYDEEPDRARFLAGYVF